MYYSKKHTNTKTKPNKTKKKGKKYRELKKYEQRGTHCPQF
jgi:hypothetical protein